MERETLFYLLMTLMWLVAAAIPAKIAADRGVAGNPIIWYIASLFLWPLTLLLALLQAPEAAAPGARSLSAGDSKKCPRCAELVKSEAVMCRFCNFKFPQVAPAQRRVKT